MSESECTNRSLTSGNTVIQVLPHSVGGCAPHAHPHGGDRHTTEGAGGVSTTTYTTDLTPTHTAHGTTRWTVRAEGQPPYTIEAHVGVVTITSGPQSIDIDPDAIGAIAAVLGAAHGQAIR